MKEGALDGGRRTGENENPYLAARRTWNDQSAANIASRQMFQLLGVLALLVALAGVGGASIEYTLNTALRCSAMSGVTRRASLTNAATAARTTRGSAASACCAGATATGCPSLSTPHTYPTTSPFARTP